MFSENAVGVSQKWWMVELSNLCHCVQHPWKLTSRDFWSSRNERKPLSEQKCVLRKCCEVSQKWWMVELSNLCHCVQHPWKLTSRHDWSSRNKRKPLWQLKVGSFAKFGVAVFKASIVNSLGGWGLSANIGSSAKFGILVCKASLHCY